MISFTFLCVLSFISIFDCCLCRFALWLLLSFGSAAVWAGGAHIMLVVSAPRGDADVNGCGNGELEGCDMLPISVLAGASACLSTERTTSLRRVEVVAAV
ncbi:hypothetical protein K438DRAFT_1893594 [Mycena galopus ATCC 62051]|nr:hypothetical protein K438DRAFT_1893594 [Mycena galopus ATCC 62051]